MYMAAARNNNRRASLEGKGARGDFGISVIAVNNAYCKYLFDNRYGTGQSVWDGINRTTNLIVSGKPLLLQATVGAAKALQCELKGLEQKL